MIEKAYDKLNANMLPNIMYRYRDEIKSWQEEELRKELQKNVDFFRERIEGEYRDVNDIPIGLKDCIEIIGENLIYSATCYDEKFERDWNIICTMLALQYPSYARKHIKKEFWDKYINANRFLMENNVNIAKFYVLCWDVYKTAEDYDRKKRDEIYKYNFLRMSEILADLLEIYRLILSGKTMYLSNERTKGESVKIVLNVPFECYSPSFSKEKNESINRYWDSYSPNDDLPKYRVCHPISQVMLPCTGLFLRTDADLYIESVYRAVEFQKIEERISKFEPILPELEEQRTDDNLKAIDIPQKETLLLKLSNRSNSTNELLIKFQERRNAIKLKLIIERLNKVGFSRKTFWELTTYQRPNDKKKLPNKDTLIAVACAMELSKEEAEQLLISAGYIFSPAIERDMVILHFWECGVYDIEVINDILIEINMNPIQGKRKNVTY